MSEGILPHEPRVVKHRAKMDDLTCRMYAEYQIGKSLADVAALFGRTRQSVYDRFVRRGLALRAKVFLEPVEFNGHTYTLRDDGYYRKTYGNRSQLHRDMWEFHVGPIPEGWDVHHKDENKGNNTIGNFECLPKADHTRIHNPQQSITDKQCLMCAKKLVRRIGSTGIIEGPAALAKRHFCSRACEAEWRKGKPRWARVNEVTNATRA